MIRSAKYATFQSIGRRYNSDADPTRSDFRRDIGRVLYSKAFRRLAFKTQVFSPSEGDHYRNRLTHTLECAQIARVVAEQLGLCPELAEVIALAHDLGHPPFGHQGEDVLERLMKPFGGFDHNLQNVRVVTLIEVKSSLYPGLNLTYETITGIAKSKRAKRFLKHLYGLSTEHQIETAEAAVADYADDLAYTATDFDDFARYHNLSMDELKGLDLELIRRCLPTDVPDARIAVSMCVRNLVSVLVSDLIATSRSRIEQAGQDADIASIIPLLGLSDDVRLPYKQLGAFLRKRMYQDANLKADIQRGAALLEDLFHYEVQRRHLLKDDVEGHLDVCDYISGMTDRFALKKADDIRSA